MKNLACVKSEKVIKKTDNSIVQTSQPGLVFCTWEFVFYKAYRTVVAQLTQNYSYKRRNHKFWIISMTEKTSMPSSS